jgi:hypothetical protein
VPVYSSNEGGNGNRDSVPNMQGGRKGRGGSAQQSEKGAAAGGRGGGGGTKRIAGGAPMSASNPNVLPQSKKFAKSMRKKQIRAEAALMDGMMGPGVVGGGEEEDTEIENATMESYMEGAEEYQLFGYPYGPPSMLAEAGTGRGKPPHTRAARGKQGGSPPSSFRAPLSLHQLPSGRGPGKARVPPTKGSVALMKQNARHKQLEAMGGGGGGGGVSGSSVQQPTAAHRYPPHASAPFATAAHAGAPATQMLDCGLDAYEQLQQHSYQDYASAGRNNASQQDRGGSRVRGYASRGRSPSPPPYSLAAADYRPRVYDARGGGPNAGVGRDHSRDRQGRDGEVGWAWEKSRREGGYERGREGEEEVGREWRRAYEQRTRAHDDPLWMLSERERERGRGLGDRERERERRRSRSYSPLRGSRGAAARGLPPVSDGATERTERTSPPPPPSAYRSATFASVAQVHTQASTCTRTHTRAYCHACMCEHANTYRHTHMHIHIYTHRHTHTHTDKYAHTRIHTHTNAHTYAYIGITHTYTHVQLALGANLPSNANAPIDVSSRDVAAGVVAVEEVRAIALVSMNVCACVCMRACVCVCVKGCGNKIRLTYCKMVRCIILLLSKPSTFSTYKFLHTHLEHTEAGQQSKLLHSVLFTSSHTYTFYDSNRSSAQKRVQNTSNLPDVVHNPTLVLMCTLCATVS